MRWESTPWNTLCLELLLVIVKKMLGLWIADSIKEKLQYIQNWRDGKWANNSWISSDSLVEYGRGGYGFILLYKKIIY